MLSFSLRRIMCRTGKFRSFPRLKIGRLIKIRNIDCNWITTPQHTTMTYFTRCRRYRQLLLASWQKTVRHTSPHMHVTPANNVLLTFRVPRGAYYKIELVCLLDSGVIKRWYQTVSKASPQINYKHATLLSYYTTKPPPPQISFLIVDWSKYIIELPLHWNACELYAKFVCVKRTTQMHKGMSSGLASFSILTNNFRLWNNHSTSLQEETWKVMDIKGSEDITLHFDTYMNSYWPINMVIGMERNAGIAGCNKTRFKGRQ